MSHGWSSGAFCVLVTEQLFWKIPLLDQQKLQTRTAKQPSHTRLVRLGKGAGSFQVAAGMSCSRCRGAFGSVSSMQQVCTCSAAVHGTRICSLVPHSHRFSTLVLRNIPSVRTTCGIITSPSPKVFELLKTLTYGPWSKPCTWRYNKSRYYLSGSN